MDQTEREPSGAESEVQSDPRQDIEPGDTVTLSWDPDSGEARYHSAETEPADRELQTGR
ncbi:TOBE domain-containing protein [Halovenus sp. WSH3]|uniref:TOBE domain-containing protein n=1 Tax=Halovenus carboxidivorans TaxID=2692199 RepID=A0A6B0T885_9EURY|nr:TOBE domain-containing protein [Halovenus carboxidivorans]MXR52426.1 TOBE domain-containing protein [Halovenus carboxidivorans]